MTIDFATEQTTVEVDEREYLLTAMPATMGLSFMVENQEILDNGKPDQALMKKVITSGLVSFENKVVDAKRFDILFSRRYAHIRKLYNEIIKFNFEELFQSPDSEE